MKLYDVPGHTRPLLLSDEHAELIGGTEHQPIPPRPGKTASKAAWVDYAIGHGADAATAEAATRAELIATYGGD